MQEDSLYLQDQKMLRAVILQSDAGYEKYNNPLQLRDLIEVE